MEYMLPYSAPNIWTGVYMIDCQIFSSNGTLLRKSAEVYQNGFTFIVKSFLASTVFYPLAAFGFIREGETREFECVSDEAFVCFGFDCELELFPTGRSRAIYVVQSKCHCHQCLFESWFENDRVSLLSSTISVLLWVYLCVVFGSLGMFVWL